jgi:hypothetical protein
MKKFIERIRDAYEYQWAWQMEPWFFKAFMVALIIPYALFKVVLVVVTGLTSPLWIVPYAIWWTKKNK